METSSRHSGGGTRVEDAPVSSGDPALRRDVALAVIIWTLLLLGVAVGGTLSAREESLLGPPAATAAPESAAEAVYFPSQYVNQGVEPPADMPTF